MTHYYRHRPPGRRETLLFAAAASVAATVVGAVTFYLMRVFVSRERLGPPAARRERSSDERGERREPESAR